MMIYKYHHSQKYKQWFVSNEQNVVKYYIFARYVTIITALEISLVCHNRGSDEFLKSGNFV